MPVTTSSEEVSRGPLLRRLATCFVVGVVLVLLLASPARASWGAMTWGINWYGELGIGKRDVLWSQQSSYRPLPVPGLEGISALSQGYFGALAVMEDGGVRAWGANGFGQLGDGSNEGPEICAREPESESEPCALSPEPVLGLPEPVKAVATGGEFSLALLQDGTVVAWGDNSAGELGINNAGPERCTEGYAGSPAPCSRLPVRVPGVEHVRAIAAEHDAAFALLEDGTVLAWGDEESGKLGTGGPNGTFCECEPTPEPIAGLGEVTQLAAGSSHMLALQADGHVQAWGSGVFGELGQGEDVDSWRPIEVPGLENVAQVAAGGYLSAALLKDGTVEEWGGNELGELGRGTWTGPEHCLSGWSCSTRPLPVPGVAGVKQIATGWEHTIALLDDGTLLAWGSDNGGPLGVEPPELCEVGPDSSGTSCSTVPVHVPGVADVMAVAVSAGGESSAALGPFVPRVEGVEDEGEPEGEPPVEEGPPGEEGHGGGEEEQARERHELEEEAREAREEREAEAREELEELEEGREEREALEAEEREEREQEREEREELEEEEREEREEEHHRRHVAWGTEKGGTHVTIEGTDLAGATAVHFGNRAASFSVVGLERVTAIAPPGHGTVNITVTTPRGHSRVRRRNRFTYVSAAPPPPPSVTGVTPKHGPSTGGTPITITGHNFVEVLSVSVGGTQTGANVMSPTEIRITAPPGAAGAAAVSVSTRGGSSGAAKKARFLYGAPVVSGLSPAQGSLEGGESVEITGSGFAPGKGKTVFLFRQSEATDVECTSTRRCTAVVPAGAKPGPVAVTVKVKQVKGHGPRFVYQ